MTPKNLCSTCDKHRLKIRGRRAAITNDTKIYIRRQEGGSEGRGEEGRKAGRLFSNGLKLVKSGFWRDGGRDREDRGEMEARVKCKEGRKEEGKDVREGKAQAERG